MISPREEVDYKALDIQSISAARTIVIGWAVASKMLAVP